MSNLTNATKGVILGVVVSFLSLLSVFNVPLEDAQQGAIITFTGAVMTAWIALTYKDSPKRLPDELQAAKDDGLDIIAATPEFLADVRASARIGRANGMTYPTQYPDTVDEEFGIKDEV